MRSFKAISLIVLLAFPGVLCICFLHWQKAHIRHEVKEMLIHGIDRDSLTTLTFSKDETGSLLDWEHDKEFEYAGEMYDVVETLVHGDSITYHCWKDHEETHLNDLLTSITSDSLDKDPLNRSQRTNTTDILKVHYLTITQGAIDIQREVADSPNTYLALLYTHSLLPPPTPPPTSA